MTNDVGSWHRVGMTPTPAPPPSPPPPSQPGLGDLVRTVLTDVRILIGAVVALFLAGAAAFAQVQTIADRTVRQETASLDASLKVQAQALVAHQTTSDATHRLLTDEVAGLKIEVRETRSEVEGLRRDLRRLFPSLPPMDGGTP